MKKIAQGIVRLRKLILTVAVLLLIPSAIGAIATRINYDILTYLPQDLDSMIGEVALEETRAVIHGRLRLYDMSTPSTFSESRPGVVVLRVRAETKASRNCGGLTM